MRALAISSLLVLSACGARTALESERRDAGSLPEGSPCEGPVVILVDGARGLSPIATGPLGGVYYAEWFFGGSVFLIVPPRVESQELALDQPAVRALAGDRNGIFWVATGLSERGGTLVSGVLSTPRSPPRVLLEDLFQPGDLAVDARTVFFTEGSNSGTLRDESRGVIERIERDGTGRQVLASGLGLPTSLAIDGTHVYWVDRRRGLVARVAQGGGAIEQLARDRAQPSAIAIAGADLFWLEGDAIRSMPATGGEVRTVAGAPAARDLAVTATHVLWTSDEGLHRAPRAGGDASLLSASPRSRELLVLGSRVYWTGGADDDAYVRTMCLPE